MSTEFDAPRGEGAGAPAPRPSALRAAIAIAAMTAVYFCSYFQRVAVPGTIFNELQADLRLSAAAVTALGSTFLYIYAGMQLFVGMSADRFGGTRTLLVGGVFLAAGAVAFPLARSAEALYASRALTGFGASFMYLSIVKEVDLLFGPRRFPTVLGIVLLFGYAGGIAGTLPFERLVAACGWREALTGVGVLTWLALAAAFAALRGLDHFSPPEHSLSFRPLLDVIRNRRSRPLLCWSLLNFPVYFVIQSILGKKFLQDCSGLSSRAAASFTLIMMIVCAASAFCGGFMLRLTRNRRKPHLLAAVLMLLTATTLMLYGILSRSAGWVFLISYVLLAASNFAGPAGAATMKELNHPDTVGQAIAVQNACAYAGVAILANVSGVVLDSFRSRASVTAAGTVYPREAYAAVLGLLVAVGVVSLIVSSFIPETRGHQRPARI